MRKKAEKDEKATRPPSCGGAATQHPADTGCGIHLPRGRRRCRDDVPVAMEGIPVAATMPPVRVELPQPTLSVTSV
jgi:hypothetical protein